MISALLVVVLAVAAIVVLLGILGIANRIDNNVKTAADNVHRIRARLERDGHRLQDLLTTVERLEHHVRGPGRAFGPPPASSPPFSTDEIEPNL